MRRGQIILRPSSGLCNRLRAIGCAYRLSHELGIGLRVEWFRCPVRRWAGLCGMLVGFSDLFEDIPGVPVAEKIKVRNDFPWNFLKWSKHNHNFYCEERRREFVREEKADPGRSRWLWTCYPFYSPPDFSWVKPKEEIASRINEFARGFGDRYIGIHVRRTDNLTAIEASPLSLFEERMDAEIRMDDRARFFLSTDDPDVKVELRKRYGNRVRFCANVAPRYTRRGEEDAVVDLMLLSRAKKIYGSYWSSFSEVAAQIGQIPLEVLAVQGKTFPKWEKN